MSISGVPETGVTFFKFGGHSHDGFNSSEIDTSSYSIFDFGTGISTGNGDAAREQARSLNQSRFNGYVASFISSQILAPAGIILSENSVTGISIGAREITADKILANTITANEIAANTITANQIAAGTITATQIAATTITANEIAANTITANKLVSDIALINNVIRSNNYVAGTTGWKIANTGTAEFSGATFRGTISATAGNIGGWNISAGNISAGTTILFSNGLLQSGSIGSGSYSSISGSGVGTFIGSSHQNVDVAISNIANSNVTNGTTFSANAAGYLKTLYGNISGLDIGSVSIDGTLLQASTGSFSVGSVSTGAYVALKNDGSIVFKYNGAGGPSIVTSGTGVIEYSAASQTIFRTNLFRIIQSSGTTSEVFVNLPSASVGLTALGIDSAGKIYKNTSKRSLKYDISTFSNSVDIIKQLNPVTYKWRSNALESDLVKFLKDNDTRYGFILEDVEDVSKSLVTYSYDGPVGISDELKFSDPTNFTAEMFDANGILSIVTGALKELIERVEILETASGG